MTHRQFYPAALVIAAIVTATLLGGCAARRARAVAPRPADPAATVEPDGRVFARIIAYNVQNLFDGTDHGGEYPEFRASAGWDRGDYYERLERLGEAIRRTARDRAGGEGRRTAGGLPDIVVLTEVESASVAADLARDFLRRYRWVSGAPEPGRAVPSQAPGRTAGPEYPGAATRIAVLSRRRPELRSHRVVQLDLVPGAAPRVRWQGRETLELRFARRGLRLLAAHWKSQSGGERETEPKRILEAALVHDLLQATSAAEADYPVTLLVGDLNEDLHEARQHGGAWPTALVPWSPAAAGDAVPGERAGARIRFVEADSPPAGAGGGDGPVFRTLWHGADAPGTYRYRGEWERLDHAFLLAGDEYRGRIAVGAWDELFDAYGGPARYDARRGGGYSDHLPILVTVTRRRAP